MPPEPQSPKRLRWWERAADERVVGVLKLLLHKDELTLVFAVFFLIVSTPWVLLVASVLAAAGVLCAFLIRSANRKQSS